MEQVEALEFLRGENDPKQDDTNHRAYFCDTWDEEQELFFEMLAELRLS